MDNTLEQHRRLLIKKAIENWEEKGDLREVEKDPIVKLLFSALAYQSYSISREISVFQEKTITEFRNKLIPYHLIKPFPAYSVVQTKIRKNNNDNIEPVPFFVVDEKSAFGFGKNNLQFTPLFKTKIVNANISNITVDDDDCSIKLDLSSEVIIDDFSGMSFYFEETNAAPDIEISMNDQILPVVRPDDYDNLPFTDWFQHHFLLREENQLQFGNYDYWQELFLKQSVNIFYINEYNSGIKRNTSNSPVFKIHFKNKSDFQSFREYSSVKINCLPVVNVQKKSETLSDNAPMKKLSTDNSFFLNLLVGENTNETDNDFFIRHFGIERYNQEELLLQLNDIFNRFISDYYAFKSIDELKKGEKIDNLYKSFKELLPIVMKNNSSNHSGVYAILKLTKKMKYQFGDLIINYLSTNSELANGIKEGEKPGLISDFLDKEGTALLKETSGGRDEEVNEDNLNHMARYNLLTKDRLVTSADLKAFCYRELKNRVRNVTINNTGDTIDIRIQLNEESTIDPQERKYHESLLQQKIKVRSLLSIPVVVTIDS